MIADKAPIDEYASYQQTHQPVSCCHLKSTPSIILETRITLSRTRLCNEIALCQLIVSKVVVSLTCIHSPTSLVGPVSRNLQGLGALSDCLKLRLGMSCRGGIVNPQQPPKPRPYPWDTSVFVPESRVRGVLFARRNTGTYRISGGY